MLHFFASGIALEFAEISDPSLGLVVVFEGLFLLHLDVSLDRIFSQTILNCGLGTELELFIFVKRELWNAIWVIFDAEKSCHCFSRWLTIDLMKEVILALLLWRTDKIVSYEWFCFFEIT